MIGRAALPYTPHVESRIPPLRAGDPIFVNSWGHPLTYKNLYNRIKKIGRIAEIENIKPHRWRNVVNKEEKKVEKRGKNKNSGTRRQNSRIEHPKTLSTARSMKYSLRTTNKDRRIK